MTDDEVALLLAIRILGAGLERSAGACDAFASLVREVADACQAARDRIVALPQPYDEERLSAEGVALARIVQRMAEPLEFRARDLEASVGELRSAMVQWSAARRGTSRPAGTDALLQQLSLASAAAGVARLTIADLANAALNLSRALPETAPVMLRIGVAARRAVFSCGELSGIVVPPISNSQP